MEMYQLANAAAVYAAGFIALFLVFALLYRHAYSCREDLELTALDIFDTKAAIGHHVVSASVGLVSLLIALFAPLRMAPIAPTTFCLMGPGHWWWGVRSRKLRQALEQKLASDAAIS
jgi:TctA family transporter